MKRNHHHHHHHDLSLGDLIGGFDDHRDFESHGLDHDHVNLVVFWAFVGVSIASTFLVIAIA
jgi:hypothetical protein